MDSDQPTVARDLLVAAGLLYEKSRGRQSSFSEFIKSLPSADSMPTNLPYWDELQLDALSTILSKHTIWKKLSLDLLQKVVSTRPDMFGNANLQMYLGIVNRLVTHRQWADDANP